jgi:chromosome partitioning protein
MPDERTDDMLRNLVLVLNGKGGVGKSTLTANLAGLAALSGWKVLAVDLDRQGNLARDLGYLDRSDNGASMVDAFNGTGDVLVIRGVRENLDVIAGGRRLDLVVAQLQAEMARGNLKALDGLERALAPLAGEYNLILLDSAPGEALVHLTAARAARAVLIPTKTDDASIDGLSPVGEVLANQADANPDVEVLGVVIMFAPAGAKRLVSDARRKLEELAGDSFPVFQSTIRSVPAIADACRDAGKLAHEYESDAGKAESFWKARRAGRKAESFSAAAPNLAGDYQALANEVLERFASLDRPEVAAQ